MRIAYLSGNTWPGREPGLSFSLHNALGFQSLGADLTLILSAKSPRAADEIQRDFFRGGSCPPVHAIASPSIGGSRQIYYWRASRHIASAGYDLLVFRALTFLPWAVRLKRRHGIPIWFEAHDFWTAPELRDEVIKKTRQRHIRLEQRYVREVDGIFCVSEPQAELYRRYYPSIPVVAAPTACQPPCASERSSFSYTLGYVGSLNESKYPLSVVLQAMSELSDPRIGLLTVGARNDEQKAELARLAREYGVADRVESHGWKVGTELAALEDRMDVGVACLTDSFLNRVASPLKVLEYLSRGLPFVATRLEGIGCLVQDGVEGMLVENDPKAWARAIDSMYRDFGRWEVMSRAGLDAARRMSWENRARTMMRALDPSGAELVGGADA